MADYPVRLDPSRPPLSAAALADRTRGVGHGMCVYAGHPRPAPSIVEQPAPQRRVDVAPPSRAGLPGWLRVALVVAAVVALVWLAVGGVR